MSELKPCPFCGRHAVLKGPDDRTRIWAECLICNVKSPVYLASHGGTFAEAIAAWNTRASDTRIAELEAEVERLREDALEQALHWVVDAHQSGEPLGRAIDHAASVLKARVLSALVQP